jgi:hypothetical protein
LLVAAKGLGKESVVRHSGSLDPEVYKRLLVDTSELAADLPTGTVAVVGPAATCEALREDLAHERLSDVIGPVIDTDALDWRRKVGVLGSESVRVIVLATDRQKEDHLRCIAPHVHHHPHVVIAGYRHFEFDDPVYTAAFSNLDEPSLANGYPNSRVHLFECLQNAARRDLSGLVVEFGMFRGGTTMFLSQAVKRLEQSWQIVGFDSFNGFPPRSSLFDLYDHPDLYEVSLAEVRARFIGHNVDVVPGDVRLTAGPTIGDRPVVVAFVDTDNYSSGSAAILAVKENVVPGGAIVLDHYTGVDRFVRTLGERMAAEDLLGGDKRYFNLHGTGVFIRQC